LEDVTINEFTFSQDQLGYGVSPYGTTSYGDPSQDITYHKLNNGRYRSLRMIYENSTTHENVIITGWELQINTPYRLQMKT